MHSISPIKNPINKKTTSIEMWFYINLISELNGTEFELFK